MAINTLRLADLRGLSADERDRKFAELTAGGHRTLNGEVEDLSGHLAEFEARYEMSSATMRRKYLDGTLPETADICSWLMLLDVRDRLVQQARAT